VDGRTGAAGRRLSPRGEIIREDERESVPRATTPDRRGHIVASMRRRLYLALIVLAILLLALGGLVVRSTASGLRAVTSA